jgi:hypothetical protein
MTPAGALIIVLSWFAGQSDPKVQVLPVVANLSDCELMAKGHEPHLQDGATRSEMRCQTLSPGDQAQMFMALKSPEFRFSIK